MVWTAIWGVRRVRLPAPTRGYNVKFQSGKDFEKKQPKPSELIAINLRLCAHYCTATFRSGDPIFLLVT